MRSPNQHPPTTVGSRLSTGLHALRLVVVFAVVIDLASTVVAQAYGATYLGPSGPLAILEMLFVVAGTVAVLWQRNRLALAISLVCAVLSCTVVATGADLWLVVTVGVMAAATARPRPLALVVGGLVAYAIAFGLGTELRHVGWGLAAGATVLGFAAGGVGAGLVARAFLRAQEVRTTRVAEYRRQNRRIRAVERARLADELQTVVTDGIANVQHQLDSTPGSAPGAELSQMLTRVDQRSRALLTELRALLDVLRREPGAEAGRAEARSPNPRHRIELLTARHVRIAAAVILLLLAGRGVIEHAGGSTDPDLVIRTAGLLACAAAVWRPLVGAAIAFAALGLAVVLHPDQPWDAVAVTLLALIGTVRVGLRRLYLVLLPLVGYGLILAADGRADLGTLVRLGYLVVIAVVIGLAGRHFFEARTTTDRQLGALADERDHIETDERAAVARELHDVVAHQLSLSTLHIMATSLSQDPDTLAATAAKVRRSTAAAREDLVTLLHAMRGPESDPGRPAPLVAPTRCAASLTGRLAENGFGLVVDIDPAVDRLDAATQRTLNRIMQEGATNILRYAPARATCRCTISIEPGAAAMTISSPLGGAERPSDLSLGWGLRGIRERVDLTHGTFRAGPRRGWWVVAVTLPQVTQLPETTDPTVSTTPAGPLPATRRTRTLRPLI